MARMLWEHPANADENIHGSRETDLRRGQSTDIIIMILKKKERRRRWEKEAAH